VIIGYWNKFPPEKKLAKAQFRFYKNKYTYRMAKYLKFDLPAEAYIRYAKLTRNPRRIKEAMRLKKLLGRQDIITESFKHFTMNQWFYDTPYLNNLPSRMSKEERINWDVDITKV
jgi:hypothetical protein